MKRKIRLLRKNEGRGRLCSKPCCASLASHVVSYPRAGKRVHRLYCLTCATWFARKYDLWLP